MGKTSFGTPIENPVKSGVSGILRQMEQGLA